MKQHKVECRIEDKRLVDLEELREIVNFYYVQNIGNVLSRSDFSKEQKIYFIEQIQKIKK